ncbi:hypothetical protein [Streptomyces sp. NPDC101150]|uniref:hypothetical protein n=1 Tax=Streptomyces sp. NPDC101150 TaxID=3366114 RepID=UPI00380C9C3F
MEEPTSGQGPEAAAGDATGEPVGAGAAEPAGSGQPASAGPGEHTGAAEAPDATPAGPQPLGVAITPTGEAAVDARLRRLADADHLPASGHLEVYEDVHRGLRDALAALDQRPGPPTPSPTFSTPHDNRS